MAYNESIRGIIALSFPMVSVAYYGRGLCSHLAPAFVTASFDVKEGNMTGLYHT